MKRENRTRAALGGMVAGIVGGAVISIFNLTMNLVTGHDVWAGLKFAGMPLLGARAGSPGFDLLAIGVGVSTHFAVSIAWGLLFGLLFHGLGKGATVAVGAAWGLVVWLTMFYLVLPIAGLGGVAKSVPLMMAIIPHVVFGLAVGIGFLPFQEHMPREDRRVYKRVPATPIY